MEVSQSPEDDPAVVQVRESLLASQLPAELDKPVLGEERELRGCDRNDEYFIGFLYRQG